MIFKKKAKLSAILITMTALLSFAPYTHSSNFYVMEPDGEQQMQRDDDDEEEEESSLMYRPYPAVVLKVDGICFSGNLKQMWTEDSWKKELMEI